MIDTPDASPLARLVLGLSPAPPRAPSPGYLSLNPAPHDEAERVLLQTAADAGVTQVATRPVGDGERLLGQAWPFPSPFRVTVRTVSIADGVDRVEARARRSLERLGLPRGDLLMISAATDLAGAEGRLLWDRLTALKDRGLFKAIGVAATVDDGPVLMARRFQPDVVELPGSLLDQRAERSGAIAALAADGVHVRLASIFARGRLFSARAKGETPELTSALSRIRRRLAEDRLDPMQAALAYGFSIEGVSSIVAGVTSAAELRALIAAAHAPAPAVRWTDYALPQPTALDLTPPPLAASAA